MSQRFAAIRVGGQKKSPDRKLRSGDFPFYPQDPTATLVREGITSYIQAGLLTFGSSY
jgi:hypothetical protein